MEPQSQNYFIILEFEAFGREEWRCEMERCPGEGSGTKAAFLRWLGHGEGALRLPSPEGLPEVPNRPLEPEPRHSSKLHVAPPAPHPTAPLHSLSAVREEHLPWWGASLCLDDYTGLTVIYSLQWALLYEGPWNLRTTKAHNQNFWCFYGLIFLLCFFFETNSLPDYVCLLIA